MFSSWTNKEMCQLMWQKSEWPQNNLILEFLVCLRLLSLLSVVFLHRYKHCRVSQLQLGTCCLSVVMLCWTSYYYHHGDNRHRAPANSETCVQGDMDSYVGGDQRRANRGVDVDVIFTTWTGRRSQINVKGHGSLKNIYVTQCFCFLCRPLVA